ncbi:MAG: hypothetical protein JW746_06825 [Candidatus Krumholzibacteriota bacterium]|nr:hypothetical protein [Candidatus Krumholzibacteriota bacterium]
MVEQEIFDAKKAAAILRPTVDSSFSNGWNQTWKHFLELLLVVVILIMAVFPSAVFFSYGRREVYGFWNSFSGVYLWFYTYLYSIFVIVPLKYGAFAVYLQAARNEKCDVGRLSEGFKNYLNAILSHVLVHFMVGIGVMFLIIPGIFLACKFSFVPFLVVDRRLDAIEAIKTSWKMTSGYAMDIFVIYLLSIPIVIAGLICLGVGILPAVIWSRVTLASMYEAVSAKEKGSIAA